MEDEADLCNLWPNELDPRLPALLRADIATFSEHGDEEGERRGR